MSDRRLTGLWIFNLCSFLLDAHLFFSGMMETGSLFVIDENSDEWMSFVERFTAHSMACTFHRPASSSKDLSFLPFRRTSLFGIIFLSLCVFLTVVFTLAWILLIYCRRLKLDRSDRLLRQEIWNSVEEYLNQSPIILYDSQAKYSDPIPDNATCTICLSPFVNGEPIRKLSKSNRFDLLAIFIISLCVCSLDCLHYYHLPCIDPWLLENGRCPLCNDMIVPIAVQSISGQINVTSVFVPSSLN